MDDLDARIARDKQTIQLKKLVRHFAGQIEAEIGQHEVLLYVPAELRKLAREILK